MQLSHALNDSLVGFVVPGEVEGGVLLGQLVQGLSHLVAVCLALGLNGNLQVQEAAVKPMPCASASCVCVCVRPTF